MTNPTYVAFAPDAPDDLVLAATPRRSTEAEVAADVQRAWHSPGADRHAMHLIAYRIDGETVRPLRVGIHRHLEVRMV